MGAHAPISSASMRRGAQAWLFAATLLLSGVAWGNELADLDRGKNAYRARAYEEADTRFRAMLDPKSGTLKEPTVVTEALMYYGAVKLARKEPAEASRIFEELLTKEPLFEPDPLSFPTDVLDFVSDTRHRLRERLAAQAREVARRDAERKAREEADRKREADRVARLERLASEETVREPRNRYVAFIPFGAGQFQNGQRALGWTLLGVETALVAVGTAVVPFYLAERRAMNETYDPSARPDATAQAESHRDSARTLQIVNLSAYGIFAATALFGVVQANLAFSPEVVRVQRRSPTELPPPKAPATPTDTPSHEGVSVAPRITPSARGLALGVEGRF